MRAYMGKAMVAAGAASLARNTAAAAAAILVLGFMEWAFTLNW